jgi:hypothetical protein
MAAAPTADAAGVSAERSVGSASAEFSVTDPSAQENVVVKIGMVGDAGVGEAPPQRCLRALTVHPGKTSLMVKYVEGSFDEVLQPPPSARAFSNDSVRTTSKRSG